MATLLQIDSSARNFDPEKSQHQSISRRLADSFVKSYRSQHSSARYIQRDLALTPPDFITVDWIAACFKRTSLSDEEARVLALSDELIDEVVSADVIVISAPMYNYGMPAALKAWFDQVIRINKTFSFDLARGDCPIEPILSGKTLVLLSSCGESGFEPGGAQAHRDHLGAHIELLSRYLGASRFFHIAAEYQEFGDERHQRSVAEALDKAKGLAADLASPLAV
ncbi:FMN-dependent NADH-azoreductase [Shewanella litorisediminis]|uniref:FMN dependent NADH:quinone oxidoreductase n=1 Tax=Shewanella litorisediminis TaxID=1173586 RepID=A0ABX7G2N2_9GAMM|nr:NAD(P)H-dependent oxidoreductase [Shewanella litorisediminis]MCL2917077.1 NAD(P)H-dependent oxidoreductase [Shewanella litorisediminis]QRH01557.1 NAD(P)H-dependent oxidoreductase [Shewanella litorisediminis]